MPNDLLARIEGLVSGLSVNINPDTSIGTVGDVTITVADLKAFAAGLRLLGSIDIIGSGDPVRRDELAR